MGKSTKVLGLTGSIGMGKSEVARMFHELGVPVFDADAAVHALYAKDGAAVEAVAREFPAALRDGAIDRVELGRQVLNDATALRRLEAIVHPLVGAAERRFVAAAADKGVALVVLDIPLLFEGGGTRKLDGTIVVSAPPEIQHARVMARPGMTEEKFQSILAKQMPDAEKRRRADHVISTEGTLEDTFTLVRRLVAQLTR